MVNLIKQLQSVPELQSIYKTAKNHLILNIIHI